MFYGKQLFIALVLSCLLSACHMQEAPESTSDAHFSNIKYGVTLSYPKTVKARQGFVSNYFMDTRWNPDVRDSQPGQGLLTLTLPASNKLLTGELRLGVSQHATSQCALPEDGNTGEITTTTLGGISFKRRDTRDAGMNHFLMRHAYRGIAHGHCFAIDLVASGTNPGVYPDNPKPPMTKQAAFQKLAALLDGLSFPKPGRQESVM